MTTNKSALNYFLKLSVYVFCFFYLNTSSFLTYNFIITLEVESDELISIYKYSLCNVFDFDEVNSNGFFIYCWVGPWDLWMKGNMEKF